MTTAIRLLINEILLIATAVVIFLAGAATTAVARRPMAARALMNIFFISSLRILDSYFFGINRIFSRQKDRKNVKLKETSFFEVAADE